MAIYIVEMEWPILYGVDTTCYAFATKQEAIDFAANFNWHAYNDKIIVKSKSLEEEDDGTCIYTYEVDPDSTWQWFHCTEVTFTIRSYKLSSGKPFLAISYWE